MKKITPITFDDMADKFSEWLKVNRKSVDYKYTLPPAKEYFKGRLLGGITEKEIEDYRAQRKDVPTKADTSEGQRPRSNSTLNH